MAYAEHLIDWDDATVARLWDYYSRTPRYSEIYFSKLFGDRMLRLSGLPLDQPLHVLDFGCGPGFIWDHLQQLESSWQYTGIDFSPSSIEKLLARAQAQPRFAGARHVSRLPVELPAAHFDGVLLFEVVEHLRDDHLEATLVESRRLLKPAGRLVISTPNAENLDNATRHCPECGAIFHEWQHVRSWSIESLADTLGSHGFKLERMRTLDFAARGVRGMVRQLARGAWHGRRDHPHLIATFRRQ